VGHEQRPLWIRQVRRVPPSPHAPMPLLSAATLPAPIPTRHFAHGLSSPAYSASDRSAKRAPASPLVGSEGMVASTGLTVGMGVSLW
jgi:hypothetical protein